MLRTPFVPTPYETGLELLKCLDVTKDDVVVDLGSGDGRIPFLAVSEMNARAGVGIEIDERLCKESYTKLGDRIEIICGDLYFVLPGIIKRATVITAYLTPMLVEELEKALVQLQARNLRIGLHDFPFTNIKPSRVTKAVAQGILWPIESTLYCYEL